MGFLLFLKPTLVSFFPCFSGDISAVDTTKSFELYVLKEEFTFNPIPE